MRIYYWVATHLHSLCEVCEEDSQHFLYVPIGGISEIEEEISNNPQVPNDTGNETKNPVKEKSEGTLSQGQSEVPQAFQEAFTGISFDVNPTVNVSQMNIRRGQGGVFVRHRLCLHCLFDKQSFSVLVGNDTEVYRIHCFVLVLNLPEIQRFLGDFLSESDYEMSDDEDDLDIDYV